MLKKIVGATSLGFITGAYLAYRGHNRILDFKRTQHQLELSKMHTEAFHAGYNAAVDDPTVKWNHYVQFQAQLEETQN